MDHGRRALGLLRDVLLLHLFTVQPPDRVGVVRRLRPGDTLKRAPFAVPAKYELDLTAPHAHKTSRFYGPSKTSISPLIAPWITKYLTLAGMGDAAATQPYLFHPHADWSRPLSPSL